jgi:plastocyanin
LAAAAAGLLPSPSNAVPAGASTQVVSGNIKVPNPTKAAQNVSRHVRTAGLIGPETNGVISYYFAVDPSTVGGEFTLTSVSAGADYDIIFYADPGSISGSPSATAEYLGAAGSGEAGLIPSGTTKVLIYPAAGANTDFVYTGYAVPQIAIGTGSLDVSIPAGGSVTWVNETADYTFVDGGDFFRAGVGAGKGIPVGGTFTANLADPGEYLYTTSAGTGTITVR